ncbi:hypothetical protein BsIDN1_43810 [Bacillus safensis]|uniref:Uncharacterized protein n=1 Tax=Bacillus safensis TaxID=561879 RepID=A0A5S9MCC1_BACIA|nr:hypothetical protein BsIDN1_43810 [Bacillus safensis]
MHIFRFRPYIVTEGRNGIDFNSKNCPAAAQSDHSKRSVKVCEKKQYGVSLTSHQAAEVAKLMNGKNINIFNDSERNRLLKQVEAITSKQTAQTVNDLFNQFTS